MLSLKTCPFCGGRPYLEQAQRGFVNGKSTHVCFIRCSACNARSPRLDLSDFGRTSNCAEAVRLASESWNKRAENTEMVEVKTKQDRARERKQRNNQNTECANLERA